MIEENDDKVINTEFFDQNCNNRLLNNISRKQQIVEAISLCLSEDEIKISSLGFLTTM